eukprot:2149976-Amphidinium_carterae.1
MQADVRRLRAASGRCNQSALCAVAGAVSQVSFYNDKVSLFLAKTPAMESKGPKALAYLRELKQLRAEKESIGILHDMARSLPDLQESLMPGCCDELIEIFAKTVVQVYDRVKSSEDTDVQLLMDLMTEASCVVPLNSTLAELTTECTELVSERKQMDLQVRLESMAEEVVWGEETSLEVFLSKCQEWGAQLTHCHLSKEALEKVDMSAFKSAIVHICTMVGQQLSKEKGSLDIVEQCLHTAFRANVVVPSQAFESDLACLFSGVALHRCLADAVVQDATAIDLIDLQKCVALTRAVETSALKLKSVTNQNVAHVKDMPALIEKGEDQVQKLQYLIKSRCKQNLEKALTDLKPIAGGQPAGKPWLDEDICDWEAFLAHASKTILRMDAHLLDNALSTAKQA